MWAALRCQRANCGKCWASVLFLPFSSYLPLNTARHVQYPDTVPGLSLLNGGLLFQTLSDYSRKYGTLSYVQGIFEYLKMI